MEHRRLSKAVDNTILVCLTIQIAFVSISIAVSSIAFGIWVGLWFIQIIVTKKTGFDKKILSELKLINIFILAYFFFEIFSRFYALYPEGAFNNLKRLLLFLIFFVSIIKIINFQTLSRIIFIVVCTISFISVLEIFQYLLKFGELINQMSFSEIRIDYFNYPLTAGEIKMLVFFLVFPLLFIKEKFLINKKLFIIILLPVFISMILTQSRNVFLSVLICFIIFGLIVNRKFLAGLIIVIILSIMILPSEVLDRFKSIADPDHPSNAARLYMWDTGMKMFFDHPLTGIADSHIREIYSTYKKIETQGEGDHLHSNFIMILATTGIFGFMSYIGMFLLIFLKQIKFYRRSANNLFKMLIMGSILAMISFHISGIFEWNFGDHEVMTVFFFLISVPFILNKFDQAEDESK